MLQPGIAVQFHFGYGLVLAGVAVILALLAGFGGEAKGVHLGARSHRWHRPTCCCAQQKKRGEGHEGGFQEDLSLPNC